MSTKVTKSKKLSIKLTPLNIIIGLVVLIPLVFWIIFSFKTRTNQLVINSMVKSHYENEIYSFDYPNKAQIMRFDRDDKTFMIRVKISNDESIDIEPEYFSESAKAAVDDIYQFKNFSLINVMPYEITNGQTKGWKYRRFIQNIRFSSVESAAFYDSPKGVYKIRNTCLYCTSGNFKISNAFELIAQTFQFK